MFSQQKGVLILAVVMGIVAIILVVTYASRIREEAEGARGQMASVLTVTRDVEQGATLSPDLLKEMQVPKKWQHPASLGPEDKEDILGARTTVPVKADQQLTWADIDRAEDGFRRLSDSIKPGERAITLPVDANSGLSGLLHPNDHVDVIATFTVPSEVDAGLEVSDRRVETARKLGIEAPHYALKTVTVTLLQNVTILATGRITGIEDNPAAMAPQDPQRRDQMRYQNVTLLVTPKEAEILAYTIRKGEITLSLRSSDDLQVIEDFGTLVFTDIVEPEERKVIQQQHNKIQTKRREALPQVIYGKDDKSN